MQFLFRARIAILNPLTNVPTQIFGSVKEAGLGTLSKNQALAGHRWFEVDGRREVRGIVLLAGMAGKSLAEGMLINLPMLGFKGILVSECVDRKKINDCEKEKEWWGNHLGCR